MGRLVGPAPEGWLVQLDNGEEVVAQIGLAEHLYQFTVGERLCVSFLLSRALELTAYLT